MRCSTRRRDDAVGSERTPLWLAALALNAMALVRRGAYGHEWRWVRMKRIRAVWIHLVARVTRHGPCSCSAPPERLSWRRASG